MTRNQTPPSKAEYQRAAALREVLRAFSRRTELTTRAAGLTPRIYQLLLMVRTAHGGEAGAGLLELEQRLQLGKSTITELVTRCEERGLVRRELDRDRRRGIRVCLTAAGARRLARVVAELGDERLDVMQRLGGLAARKSRPDPSRST